MALKAKYTKQLVVMVTPHTDAAIRELSDGSDASLSQALRDVILAGYPIVKRQYAKAAALAARDVSVPAQRDSEDDTN